MVKKTQAQREKEDNVRREAFWADIKEVEAKHKMVMAAFLQYSQQGIIPVIGAKILDEHQPTNKDTKVEESKE